MLAPLSTPLKVWHREGRLVVDNEAGDQVVAYTFGDEVGPAFARVETAGGTWWIGAQQGDVAPVVDAASTHVATIHRGLVRRRELEFAGGGEAIATSPVRVGVGYGVRFGDWGSAQAPFLRPGRYCTLKLSDALLARPDAELAAALMAYTAHGLIRAKIAAGQTSSG